MRRRTWLLIPLLLALPALAQYGNNQWTIVRADYGAGSTWRDVTSNVQSLVRGNNLNFQVSNQTLGGDPAPGSAKTLKLQVRRSFAPIQTLTFAEGSTVNLQVAGGGTGGGGGFGGLQITRAMYGAGSQVRDVTNMLNSQIRDNRLSLVVNNGTMGGDPAPGARKSLTVTYNYQGRPGQVTVNEDQTLNLGGAGGGGFPGGYPGGGFPGGRGLQIVRADYGASGRVVDVTDRLRSQMRGNQVSLRVTNETMGGDPVQEQVKTLTVWYLYNGRMARAAAKEKTYITIPPSNPIYVGNLQILRAQYGADYRFRDVTDLLNSQIRNNQLSLRITNDSMGGDPAPDRSKTLTVTYVYNGQQGQTTVNEKDTLNLPGAGNGSFPGFGNQLQILRATWGAPGRESDVTSRLQSQVSGNTLSMQVNNGTMGGDPAAGTSKRLRVIYQYQGLRYETNVPENGQLSLP